MTANVIHGSVLVHGTASGEVAALSSALSLWGGFDLETGAVADVHHPQYGTTIADKILVMPGGRGSSSSSSILLESARLGVNPLAIVITSRDPILVIGALVADDLYRVRIPVVLVEAASLDRLVSGQFVEVNTEGENASITIR